MEAFARLKSRLDKQDPYASHKEPAKSSATSVNIPSSQPTSSNKPLWHDASPSSRPPTNEEPKTFVLRPAVESWPVEMETPLYKIKVSVYYYLVAQLRDASGATTDLNCWTYISSGLHPIAGGELILSVRRRNNEQPGAYPLDFRRICDKIYAVAVRNQTKLRRWQLIEFQEPLFGRQDFHTIVLGFHNIPLFGLEEVQVDMSQISYFYGLVLTDEELAVAQKHGQTRALVVGGTHSGWFPYPAYVDRDRKSGASLTAMEGSASGNGTGTKLDVQGLNVIQIRPDVYLHIPEDRVEAFKKAILSKSTIRMNSLKIESEMHESCDSVYSWQPDATVNVLHAGHEGSRFTAMNFLLLCPNQSMNAIKVVEDGCLGLLYKPVELESDCANVVQCF
jgi:hypothetical protein